MTRRILYEKTGLKQIWQLIQKEIHKQPVTLDHPAAFHNEINVLQYSHVQKRITLYGDDIRQFTCLQSACFCIQAK